jgi:lysozyme family protein
MADRFDACLAFTLREEGGYVDDPADPLHWP